MAENQSSPERPIPPTRAPEPGTPPAAGTVSPAEKLEPSGTPVEEQHHNADPNAPQTQVVPPGSTQHPESETGGIPASSIDVRPPLGTEEARLAAQVPNTPPPPDAGQGSSKQDNEPNESRI